MPFRRAMARADLWCDEMIGLVVDGVPVVLLDVDNEVCAYADRCAHQRVKLSEGTLAAGTLTCRAHGWSYDALTGCGRNPESACLERFPVRVEGDDILIDVQAGMEEERA